MGVRVYIATDRAEAYAPTVLALDSATRGLLDTNTLTTSEFYEVTQMVSSVAVRRGRGDTELDAVGAGTARVVLDDPDGLFDPTYLESPLYPGARSGMRVKITTSDGIPLFVGRVDDTDVTRSAPFTARVSLDLVDEMAVFAQADLTPTVRAQERISERINYVLQSIAYAGDYNGDRSNNEAYAADLSTVLIEGNAAAHLNDLARSDGFGLVFIDRTGAVRFRSRSGLALDPTPAVTFVDRTYGDQQTSTYDGGGAASTMTDALDGGTSSPPPSGLTVDGGSASTVPTGYIPYNDYTGSTLGKTVVNASTVTNRNGVVRTSSNALSIGLNGYLSTGGEIKQAEAWWVDILGAEAQRQADSIVAKLSDGGYGIVDVSLETDQLGSAQRDLVARLEIGDTAAVALTPPYSPSASTFYQSAIVVGVEHKCSANGYGFSSTIRFAAATGSTTWT